MMVLAVFFLGVFLVALAFAGIELGLKAVCKIREALFIVAVLVLLSSSVNARCRITNETTHNFRVDSGDTYGQTLGAHSSTSIDAGDIVGQSVDGREFSASCEDGESLVVREVMGRIRAQRREW